MMNILVALSQQQLLPARVVPLDAAAAIAAAATAAAAAAVASAAMAANILVALVEACGKHALWAAPKKRKYDHA